MGNIIRRVSVRISTALILIIVLLTCGCQPTPEKNAVIYGGDFQEKVESTPAATGVYDAPEIWQETLDMKGSDMEVEINADIIIPNVMAFPIYRVKQKKFDDAQVQPLVKYFVQDGNVIKYKKPTKSELEHQIILARKNNDEEMVAEFEKMLAAAPETVATEYVTDWAVDGKPSGSFLTKDGEYASISISPDVFIYMNGSIETESMLVLNDKKMIGDIAITNEGAIAAAQDILHELGINNMVVSNIEKAQCYAVISNSSFAEYSEKPKSQGHFIKFARSIDGIAARVNEGLSFYTMDDFAYTAPFYPEEIQIYVDESGTVQTFVWQKLLNIEEKLNENTVLLPFDEVKQRIRDMLIFINSYNSKPTIVTSIEMNMTIINVKDQPGEAMYVPAWYIFYTKIYENYTENNRLVLNAIDGGRVLEGPPDPEIYEQMEGMELD